MQRKHLGLILASVGVVLILVAAVTRTWWRATAGDDTVAVGLRGVEECETSDEGEECESQSFSTAFRDREDEGGRRKPTAFIVAGQIAFYGGIAASLLIALVAVLVLGRPGARGPGPLGVVAAVACGAFAVAGAVFLIARPDELKAMPTGPALVLGLLGVGCGVAGSLLLGGHDPARPAAPVSGGRPVAGMAVSGGAVVLILISLMTHLWWSAERRGEGDLGVGVRSAEVCDKHDGRERCQEHTLMNVDKEFRVWNTFGSLTYHSGLLSVGLLGLAVLLAAGGGAVPGPVTPARLAVATSAVLAVCAIGLVATLPDAFKARLGLDLKLGAGVVLCVAGAIAGAVGGVLLATFRPPPAAPAFPGYPRAPTPIPGSMAAPLTTPTPGPVPACSQCAAPMAWVAQHGRWFCGACRLYA